MLTWDYFGSGGALFKFCGTRLRHCPREKGRLRKENRERERESRVPILAFGWGKICFPFAIFIPFGGALVAGKSAAKSEARNGRVSSARGMGKYFTN